MVGASMPDLKLKDKCLNLKLGWLARLLTTEGYWKDFVINKMPIDDIDIYLECNIKYGELIEILQLRKKFDMV